MYSNELPCVKVVCPMNTVKKISPARDHDSLANFRQKMAWQSSKFSSSQELPGLSLIIHHPTCSSRPNVKQAQTQPLTTSQTADLLPLLPHSCRPPLAKFGIAERLVQTEKHHQWIYSWHSLSLDSAGVHKHKAVLRLIYHRSRFNVQVMIY